MAELGLVSGILVYHTTNVEDKEMVGMRATASNLDVRERAALARRALEEWKRSQFLADEHLHPSDFPRMECLWSVLMYSARDDKPGLREVCGYWIGGSTLRWNWDINREVEVAGSYTGIRTTAEMWQSELTNSFVTVNPITDDYYQTVREGDWRLYLYCQKGEGADKPQKERDLIKM